MRRTSPVLLAAALAVAVVLVAGTAMLWPRDHPASGPGRGLVAWATWPPGARPAPPTGSGSAA
jgi:hypothetical protein